jgi:imidazolonepropionase-like amidohydrolase
VRSKIESGERLGARVFSPPIATPYGSLTLAEALRGKTAYLDRSLVAQVSSRDLIEKLKRTAQVETNDAFGSAEKLMEWFRTGKPLLLGTDAGRSLLTHGPSVQRELELWVASGVPPEAALLAATGNASTALHAGTYLGQVRKGYDADLLLVDGNPLEDIFALERVSEVFVRGERVDRASLLDQK